jgi:hypothetical protein
VIYFLGLHPDVCHRLREEVLDTFGPAGAPTYPHLKKMQYRTFNPLIRASVVMDLVTEWLSYLSPCRAQGNPPSLHVRPAYCANVSRPTTRHPGHGQTVPPTQDADHDVLPPCTQATRPVGRRCRSLPSGAVVRPRFARQGYEDTVHVLAVLRRSACCESRPPSTSFLDLC